MDKKSWGPDTTNCQLCFTPFSLFFRRHHCRSCGLCICAICSVTNFLLPKEKIPKRVCTVCKAKIDNHPSRLLPAMGLEVFVPVLEKEGIYDDAALLSLTRRDLEGMGVPLMERERLYERIEQINIQLRMQANWFNTLPEEVLLHIFSYLSPKELYLASMVCKSFHANSMDKSLWKGIVKPHQDEGWAWSWLRSWSPWARKSAYVESSIKKHFPFEKRRDLSARIREKYPDRIPVIVDTVDGLQISKQKFLCPLDITVSMFTFEIRRHMQSPQPNQVSSIYLYTKGTLPQPSEPLYKLYEKAKDEDGFLYFCMSASRL